MANNYQQAAAHRAIPCSQQEFEDIKAMMANHDDDNGFEGYHGFDFEWYKERAGDSPDALWTGALYMFASECADLDRLPPELLKAIGALLKKAGLRYLKIGVAYTCDKMRPGEFGGFEAKITQEGTLIYPEILWPEGYEDAE